MNIFSVTSNPKDCARSLDDKRLNKMILETAQLICTCLRENRKITDERLYKSTHKNHPCSVWLRQENDLNSLNWTIHLFEELCNEYTNRTSKVHACDTKFRVFFGDWKVTPLVTPNSFPNCTTYKHLTVHEAYRIYLNDKWTKDKRQPKWTKTSQPWFANFTWVGP